MTIVPEIFRQIELIRSDRRHGANWLARQALRVLGDAAEQSDASDVPGLQEKIAAVTTCLRAARPSIAPIRFWLDRYSVELETELAGAIDTREARQRAQALTDRLIRAADEAQHAAATRAAEVIADRATVLTCSSSATVVETFRALRRLGREPRAIALASIAADGTSHGELMAWQLEALGVPAEVVPDEAVDNAIAQVSAVLIGADTVLADGAVINGTPSLATARVAARAGVPLYVVAERAKVDAELDVRSAQLEKGFDVVPGELIRRIVTETG